MSDKTVSENSYLTGDLGLPKPFCVRLWETIVFAFRAEIEDVDEGDYSGSIEEGAFEAASKNALEAFRSIDREEAQAIIRTNALRRHERFTFFLGENTNYARITLVTPPIKPNARLPPKLTFLPFYSSGLFYFTREPNVFMHAFGMSKDALISHIRHLDTAGVLRVVHQEEIDGLDEMSPMIPSKTFICKFHNDLTNAGYNFLYLRNLKDLLKPEDELPQMKMRFKLPETKISKRPLDHHSITQDNLEKEILALNRQRIEAVFVDSFLAQMAYLSSVVEYLQCEFKGLDICRKLCLLNVSLFVLLFSLIFVQITIGKIIFYDDVTSEDVTDLTLGFMCILFVELYFIHICIIEFGASTSSAISKMYDVTGRGLDRLRVIKAEFYVTRTSSASLISILLLIITAILVSLDIARNKNPMPMLTAFVIILFAAGISKEKRRIPWPTIASLLSISYIIMKILHIRLVEYVLLIVSLDIHQFTANVSNYLPKVFQMSAFPTICHWVNIILIYNFILEIVMYLDILKFIFLLIKPFTDILSITWIEASYAVASAIMPAHTVLRINTNMIRLLTYSELCLLLSVCISSYNFCYAAIFQIYGIPLNLYFVMGLVSLPVIIAFSKLVYPEAQQSHTAERQLHTYHPPIVHFTRLLTDVCITAIASGMGALILKAVAIIALTFIASLQAYILRIFVKFEGETLFEQLASYIWPFFWSFGITDKQEAKAISEIFLSRMMVNSFYSSNLFGKQLAITWLEDCRAHKNMQLYGLEYENGSDLFRKFKSPPVSHFSLSIATPFALMDGSASHFIYIVTVVLNMRRWQETRTILNVAVRAICVAVMTTMFVAAIIANALERSERIICATELLAQPQHSFCDAYVESLRSLTAETDSYNTKSVGHKLTEFEKQCFYIFQN